MEGKGDDKQSDFEQEALLGHGMDAAERLCDDLRKIGFDAFVQVLFPEMLPLFILSFAGGKDLAVRDLRLGLFVVMQLFEREPSTIR